AARTAPRAGRRGEARAELARGARGAHADFRGGRGAVRAGKRKEGRVKKPGGSFFLLPLSSFPFMYRAASPSPWGGARGAHADFRGGRGAVRGGMEAEGRGEKPRG